MILADKDYAREAAEGCARVAFSLRTTLTVSPL